MGVKTLGVIGGGGWLAGALLRPALSDGIISPEHLILSSRSGRVSGFEAWPDIRTTIDNAGLVENSDIVLLSVRPDDLDAIALDLRGKLVISVMAGIKAAEIAERFGANRIVLAMPNACAEQRLSFTPWCAAGTVTGEDAGFADAFFSASGRAHVVTAEHELAYFTALTGSGPAFPALVADAMIRHAIDAGIAPETADIAVRQLFLGAATLMMAAPETPAAIVETFSAYRGTTAAGLDAMIGADIATPIFRGLSAARQKAEDWSEERRSRAMQPSSAPAG
jgi:pyrroline-5-carboxylate reductase